MHEKLAVSGTDLAGEKEASNQRGGSESDPSHTPKKVGLAKLRLLGSLTEGEVADEFDNIMGDL